MTIRIVVADDQAVVREGLVVLLGAPDDLEVVGEAANGAEAVQVTRTTAADVVVMDIRMPTMDGIEATAELVAGRPPGTDLPRVLILTTFDLDELVHAALRAGASGFLLKDASATELADAVRVIAAGDAMLAPAVTRRLLREFSRLGAPRAPEKSVSALTDRETEVLALVAQGLSNAEIADHLVVTVETVKSHVGRILSKLGLRDRTQAAVLAWEQGVVRPRP